MTTRRGQQKEPRGRKQSKGHEKDSIQGPSAHTLGFRASGLGFRIFANFLPSRGWWHLPEILALVLGVYLGSLCSTKARSADFMPHGNFSCKPEPQERTANKSKYRLLLTLNPKP